MNYELFEKYNLDHREPEFEPGLLDEAVQSTAVKPTEDVAEVLGDDDLPF